jgi:hypothetical protein
LIQKDAKGKNKKKLIIKVNFPKKFQHCQT